MNWHDTLGQVLRSISVDAICVLDDGAQELGSVLLPQTLLRRCDSMPANHQAQLAMGNDALHNLDATQARALLARARDFIAPRIIVIADAQCQLKRLDFLALGYETLASDEAGKITLYQFDMATYKQVPDWLNARFWAHPERWKP